MTCAAPALVRVLLLRQQEELWLRDGVEGEGEEGFLLTGTAFPNVGDSDSGPCYAVSLPVLGKSVGWFDASVPTCSLGTVASLLTGRTQPRFGGSGVRLSA